jgi:hypothetical protein
VSVQSPLSGTVAPRIPFGRVLEPSPLEPMAFYAARSPAVRSIRYGRCRETEEPRPSRRDRSACRPSRWSGQSTSRDRSRCRPAGFSVPSNDGAVRARPRRADPVKGPSQSRDRSCSLRSRTSQRPQHDSSGERRQHRLRRSGLSWTRVLDVSCLLPPENATGLSRPRWRAKSVPDYRGTALERKAPGFRRSPSPVGRIPSGRRGSLFPVEPPSGKEVSPAELLSATAERSRASRTGSEPAHDLTIFELSR